MEKTQTSREYSKPRTKARPILVHNLQQALTAFRGFRSGARKVSVINLEGARVGELFKDRDGEYIVLYKREFYYHFTKHFPKVPIKGYGVMCNKKIVRYAAEYGYNIVSVFPDGRAYSIKGIDFWNFYSEYETDVPFVRATEEIACPLKLWNRLF